MICYHVEIVMANECHDVLTVISDRNSIPMRDLLTVTILLKVKISQQKAVTEGGGRIWLTAVHCVFNIMYALSHIHTHTQRERERERETRTHTHTQRERERERERRTCTHTHRERERERRTHTHGNPH